VKTKIALLAFVFAAFGCATEEKATTTATAPAACKPAPTELLTQDVQAGTGDTVRFKSAVWVEYTGWLYDGCKPDLKGKQFDTSQGRVTPFGLIVGAGRVIKGWDEGLIGIKEGGKRLLVIPPDKGYGAKGVPGTIPPNATLVFDVQVTKIIQQPQ
jgi:FKBP-type peptidyl-prolyl cis-trans isomerase